MSIKVEVFDGDKFVSQIDVQQHGDVIVLDVFFDAGYRRQISYDGRGEGEDYEYFDFVREEGDIQDRFQILVSGIENSFEKDTHKMVSVSVKPSDDYAAIIFAPWPGKGKVAWRREG